MAENVLKLKVQSEEYDAKIKRAAEGIQHFVKDVRESGSTLKEQGILARAFLKELSNMETVAKGGKQQLREMSNALVTLTDTYRGLSDAEKSSGFGQELNKQIQILTERAGEMQDAMDDVKAAITNAASDTRVFDQLAGGAQMMTAGFQSAVGAMKLFGVETDNNVEVLAQLQAAMGVVNGLQTIQTALQKQSAVMQGVQAVQAAAAAAAQTSLAGATGAATVAQKAFNMIANANPYVLLATAVAAVGTALYAFASASSKAKQEAEELVKAEEEAAKKADESRQSFVNASAEAMNSASRLSSLQVAYKNANSEMEKTNILKQAQAEFKKLGIECKGVHDAQTLLISKGADVIELIKTQGTVAALAAIRMEKFKESFKMLMENGYSASAAASLAGYNKDVQELDSQITNMQSRIQGLKGGLGIGAGGNIKTTKVEKQTDKNLDAEQKVQKKINDLLKEALTADANRQGEIRQQVAELQKQQEKYKDIKNIAQGILPKDKEAVFTIDGQLSEETKKNLREIEGVTIDDKTMTVTAETADALRALQGIEGMTIDPKTVTITATDEALPKLREIQGVTIDDKTMTVRAETADALRALQGIEGVTIDPKTVTITATDEALPKLREIQGVTIDDKTMTVTADTQEAMQKVQDLIGQVSTTTLQMKVKAQPVGMTFTAAQLDGMSFDNQIPTTRGNRGKAQDKLDLATAAFATGGTSDIDFSNYISGIKNALSNANLGDELYTSMTEKLKDATTVSTLLQEMMERGLAGADLESTAQALKEKLLSPEGIDQTAIQSFLDELNKQIEEAGGVGLKLNADTGEVTDDKSKGKDDGEDLKKFNEGIGKLTGGLSSVTSGLKAVGVEIPKEVDQVIGVISGVSQIISGVGTIISIFGTSAMTANTAALGANTFAIGSLITAIELNTATNFFPFANGGVIPAFAQGGLIGRAAGGLMIPGNSMSGDRLRMPVDGGRGVIGVNSGELILNRSSTNTLAASLLQAESLVDSISDYSVSLGNAQQMNLASQLEGEPTAGANTQPFINGEMIYLGLQAYLRRSGLGEIVTAER